MKYIDRKGNITIEENEQDKSCGIYIMTGVADSA